MATATAAKKRKTTSKVNLKKSLTDLNVRLVNTSEDVIEGTVATGEKYQKLFAKTLKRTEPLIEKQVDIVFDTMESLKDQYDFGTVRFKKLIGWKNLKKSTTNTLKSIKKNAEEKVDAIQTEFNVRTKSVNAPSKVKKATPVKVASKKVTTAKTVKMTDLKVIDGIGPKMERILNTGGIKSIDALAKSTISKVEKAIEKSGSSFRGINAEAWLTQAKQIIK